METYKVFLPYTCMTLDGGLLIGWHDNDSKIICVTGIIFPPFDEACIKRLLDLSKKKRSFAEYTLIGVWNTKTSDSALDKTLEKINSDCIILTKIDGKLPECRFVNRTVNVSFIITIFSVTELLESSHLTSHTNPCASDNSNVNLLTKKLVEFQSSGKKDLGDILDGLSIKYFVEERKKLSKIFYSVATLFDGVVKAIDGLGRCLTKLRFSGLQAVGKICHPSVSTQLRFRLEQIRSATKQSTSGSPVSNPKAKLRSCDLFVRILLDMALGILLFTALSRMDAAQYMSGVVMDWADNVVKHLQQLLHWMMGVPAGLKLNSQLDRLLGHFFLYHIYLWTGYLKVLSAYLSPLLWGISALGCFGVTFQIAMLQDLISVMTLHIYCFYVYAARLYRVQVYTLASLWRLFRGKKWNVLRKRVDSASFDVDQLFFGTLLFTILLFLLPTTALYYVVFTTLRLVTLATQGLLHFCMQIINKSPVYVLLLRAVNSRKIADNVCFSVLAREDDKPLYLSMQMTYPSYVSLFNEFCGKPNKNKQAWTEFGKKLMLGHLVYPWIE